MGKTLHNAIQRAVEESASRRSTRLTSSVTAKAPASLARPAMSRRGSQHHLGAMPHGQKVAARLASTEPFAGRISTLQPRTATAATQATGEWHVHTQDPVLQQGSCSTRPHPRTMPAFPRKPLDLEKWRMPLYAIRPARTKASARRHSAQVGSFFHSFINLMPLNPARSGSSHTCHRRAQDRNIRARP